MDKDLLAKRVRALRGKELTQIDLAEAAGISKKLVQRVESGESNTTLDSLEAIAGALGCALEVRIVSPNDPPANPPADVLKKIEALIQLSPNEAELLRLYRSSPRHQEAILNTVRGIIEK